MSTIFSPSQFPEKYLLGSCKASLFLKNNCPMGFVYCSPPPRLRDSAQRPRSRPQWWGYIHQHWPYKYPYAARTGGVEDYRNYCGGLKMLGYNSVMIWPILETMPNPPTPSDRANLKKNQQSHRGMLHHELGMRVYPSRFVRTLPRKTRMRRKRVSEQAPLFTPTCG